jgi:predicted secreted protein
MKRFDFVGGWFVRLGRKWFGLVAEFPFVYSCPVICGGTDATSSQDTYISVGDSASPNTFTEIAEVKSIGGPNEDSEELDATHLRSTGGYREFLQSFKDGGELPCNCNYLPGNATHQTIRTLFQSGATRGWKITYPDTSYVTFDGYVKAVGSTAAVGAILEGSFTIRISGAVTLVEAA